MVGCVGKSSCTSLLPGIPRLFPLFHLSPAGAVSCCLNPNPILFPQLGSLGSQSQQHSCGMVQQPWHGHFSSTFLSCPQILGDSGSTTFQEIQGKPLQMGSDRWTDVQGCYLRGAREWQLRAEINPPARGKCPFQWLPALPGAAGPSWESCLGSSTLDKITHS